MQVTGSRPSADAALQPGTPFAGDAARRALLDRAWEAQLAAREAVAHSCELEWVLAACEEGVTACRCPWCQRCQVGMRWLDVGMIPPARARMTYTACDECRQALREAEMSA